MQLYTSNKRHLNLKLAVIVVLSPCSFNSPPELVLSYAKHVLDLQSFCTGREQTDTHLIQRTGEDSVEFYKLLDFS